MRAVVVFYYYILIVVLQIVVRLTLRELHAQLLLFGLQLGKDGFHPAALRDLEHLESVFHLLFIHAAFLVQTVLGKGSGGDVKAAEDDILDRL